MQELGLTKLLRIWDTVIQYRHIAESSHNPCFSKPGGYVGQLSKKLEAAGKVRVFAMVDIWTQSILAPLHNMLTAFLASLPNDGTKDQIAS